MADRKGKRFRRTGTVRAVQLDEDVRWSTSAGDELVGKAGDWLVESVGAGQRTVAAEEFEQLYERVSDNIFIRTGEVFARRVHRVEIVETLEGRAVARPGGWIVTDDRGNQWPITDEAFRAGYS